MNWLDIILIILMVLIFIGGVVWLVLACTEDEIGIGFVGLITAIVGVVFILFGGFIVIDKNSGSTVGEITSVDKNFFGTTALYIKVNNNSEEKYCIEKDKLVDRANSLMGKKVKITYGKRIGLYSTGDCSEAPIDNIEAIKSE